MTRGYYVTAKYGHKTAWLCGPFPTHQEALAMLWPVRKAALRTDDPRFAFAAFGTAKLTAAPGKTCPPGTLDLGLLDIDEVINYKSPPSMFYA